MCGIIGLLRWNDPVNPKDRAILEKMTATLAHRGPDDSGVVTCDNIGLGHRRLSVIDLSGGHQPMCDETENFWIVFNGEIYNYTELNKTLAAQGHKIRTHSDTETLLHLYQAYGENFLDKIEGMFALALWDKREKKLLLARDRMGEKPLYYVVKSWGLLFASEPKALIAHPDVSRELDQEALCYYLSWDYVPAPFSIFKSIQKLRAGECLISQKGTFQKKIYWDLPALPLSQRSPEELQEEFLLKLEQSVKARLISDVPLGIFLSGGLDSSALAALAVRHASNVKTFSIGFRHVSYDESSPARLVASHFATDHREHMFEDQDCHEVTSHMGSWLDEPLADPSLIPTYLLSQFTRRTVTVALGGDGGDELFGGYPTYLAQHWVKYYQACPSWLKGVVKRFVNNWPISDSYMSFEFKARRFLAGADLPMPDRHFQWLCTWPSEYLKKLIKEYDKTPNLLNILDGRLYQMNGGAIAQAMALDAKTYLPEDLLTKVDRASMANSLEVRAPYLDRALLELSTQIPISLRASAFQTKILVRKAFQKLLPSSILKRPKHGFAPPVSAWLKGALRPMVEDLLSTATITSQGIFYPDTVLEFQRDHFEGRKNYGRQLWSLLVFQLWYERLNSL